MIIYIMGFWIIIDSRKKYIRPDVLARKANVPVAVAKAWLNNSGILNSENMAWRLSDAVEKINYRIFRMIVPSRWWIRQYLDSAKMKPQELATILGKTTRCVIRWLSGNDRDLIPLKNEDIEKMNERYPLQGVPFVKVAA